MKLSTVLAANAAAVVGFVAARQLLSPETDLSRLPDGVRGPLAAMRTRLVRARERAKAGLADGAAARDEAEAQLMGEYHRKAGRNPD